MKEVYLPSHPFVFIYDTAFDNCLAIEKIVCKSPIAWDIPLTVFNSVDVEKCVLQVPKGSVDSYRAAQGWNKFVNIRDDELGIFDIPSDNSDILTITTGNSITSLYDGIISIYDMSGQKIGVLSYGDCIHLTKGIYIWCAGYKTGKVVI